MSKRFPFIKRAIEALEAHDTDSNSREAKYSYAECIGLKLRDLNRTCLEVSKNTTPLCRKCNTLGYIDVKKLYNAT